MVDIILGVLLLVMAVFLIVAVLLQSNKSKGVSGTIAGGSSETYFGKNKKKSLDKKLSILTTVVTIIFMVLCLVVYVKQTYMGYSEYYYNLLSKLLGVTVTGS